MCIRMLPTYADVCRRMLTYADVYCMLTYADVRISAPAPPSANTAGSTASKKKTRRGGKRGCHAPGGAGGGTPRPPPEPLESQHTRILSVMKMIQSCRYSVYLLYQYKSANTDTCNTLQRRHDRAREQVGGQVCAIELPGRRVC